MLHPIPFVVTVVRNGPRLNTLRHRQLIRFVGHYGADFSGGNPCRQLLAAKTLGSGAGNKNS
jgi:hypothetical protein